MRRYFLFALLPLAACATPQEICIANSGKDIRVLSSLISDTQANITRGYELRTVEYFRNEKQVCGAIDGQEIFCDVAVANTRQVPFAIDLNTEAEKLASLQMRRSEMVDRQQAVIAECRIQYPEA